MKKIWKDEIKIKVEKRKPWKLALIVIRHRASRIKHLE